MKKFLFAVLLVFVLAGSGWAANPVVTISEAVYTDDGSAVANYLAIEPNRDVRLTYSIVADTETVRVTRIRMTRDATAVRETESTITVSRNPLSMTQEFLLYPSEAGPLTVRVSDGNGAYGELVTQVAARAARPGEFDPDPPVDPSEPDPVLPPSGSGGGGGGCDAGTAGMPALAALLIGALRIRRIFTL